MFTVSMGCGFGAPVKFFFQLSIFANNDDLAHA